MNVPDVIIGRTHGPRTADTLNLIDAMLSGTDQKKLIIDGGYWVIDEDVTIDEFIALEIMPDAVLVFSNDAVLTINSKSCIVHRDGWFDLTAGGTIQSDSTDWDPSESNGLFHGQCTRALYANNILPGGLGEGLELVADLIEINAADESEALAMTNNLKPMSPLGLSYVLAVNAENAVLQDRDSLTKEDWTANDSFGTGNTDPQEFHGRYTAQDEIDDPANKEGYINLEDPLSIKITITPRKSNSKMLIMFSCSTTTESKTNSKSAGVYLYRKIGDVETQLNPGWSEELAEYNTPTCVVEHSKYAVPPVSYTMIDVPNAVGEEVEYYLKFKPQWEDGFKIYLNGSSITFTDHLGNFPASTISAIELIQA